MTFPTYLAYTHSGVEWLGVVPEHWGAKQLRYLGRFRKGLTITKADLTDSGIPCLNYGEVHSLYPFEVNQDIHPLKSVPAEYLETDPSACIKYGDFVFADTSEDLDGVGNFTHVSGVEPLFAGYHTIIYSLNSEVSSRFLAYCLESFAFRTQLRMGVKGVKVFSVTQEILRSGIAWLPTIVEQTQIARFLDHETARVDTLIKEQQRLIELLKEKRQAVISHAVTKGLDPMVPMKDSGVEWLGEVPAHWVVCATRRAIRFIEQGWSPECESYPAEEDGWGVLKAGCVNRGVFDSSENKTLPSTLKPIPEYEVSAGDILMSRASGSPELVGSTALLGQVRGRLMLSDKIFRVHLEEKVNSQFFVWVMNAQFMRSQIEQALSGGNGLANNLPQSSLLAFWLAIPPEHEQGAIAELINEQTGRIDELIAEGELAVELLQERRSALISAAVTGKIDVRGWQPLAIALSPELAKEAM